MFFNLIHLVSGLIVDLKMADSPDDDSTDPKVGSSQDEPKKEKPGIRVLVECHPLDSVLSRFCTIVESKAPRSANI